MDQVISKVLSVILWQKLPNPSQHLSVGEQSKSLHENMIRQKGIIKLDNGGTDVWITLDNVIRLKAKPDLPLQASPECCSRRMHDLQWKGKSEQAV